MLSRCRKLRQEDETRFVTAPGTEGNERLHENETARQHKNRSGAPGRIRTVDLVLRRHTLYPSELRAQSEITVGRMIVLRSVVGSQWIGAGNRRKFKGTTDERR